MRFLVKIFLRRLKEQARNSRLAGDSYFSQFLSEWHAECECATFDQGVITSLYTSDRYLRSWEKAARQHVYVCSLSIWWNARARACWVLLWEPTHTCLKARKLWAQIHFSRAVADPTLSRSDHPRGWMGKMRYFGVSLDCAPSGECNIMCFTLGVFSDLRVNFIYTRRALTWLILSFLFIILGEAILPFKVYLFSCGSTSIFKAFEVSQNSTQWLKCVCINKAVYSKVQIVEFYIFWGTHLRWNYAE